MDDVTFSRGPARRPVPRVSDPLLQWATGLSTTERRIYAGWLVEVGRNQNLDGAMREAGFPQVTIKHGSGNIVTHWAVETANLFVVAEGVQSIAEMQHTADRFGIAFAWRQLQGGRQQSQLRFRAFLHELLAVGFHEPLLVTAKGTLTGDVITALTRQYDVLDAVDAMRAQGGKPPLQPPFYAASIPLGPGQEVARGSVQTKEITPVLAQVPTPVTKDYIAQHWIKRSWVPLVEALLDQTIAWSVATSLQIPVGEDQGAGAHEEEVAVPAPAPARGAPSAQANGRRRMDDDLL
ncbi:MAG TPA: hypothetical protein VFS21_25075 [Roseiflexaceae bacterium]|nr:hypothetical protein [Roseiflexaceae bacterium]